MFKGLKLQHSLFGTACQRLKTSVRALSEPLRGGYVQLQHMWEGQVAQAAAAAWLRHPQRSRDGPATPRQKCWGVIGVFTAAATVN